MGGNRISPSINFTKLSPDIAARKSSLARFGSNPVAVTEALPHSLEVILAVTAGYVLFLCLIR